MEGTAHGVGQLDIDDIAQGAAGEGMKGVASASRRDRGSLLQDIRRRVTGAGGITASGGAVGGQERITGGADPKIEGLFTSAATEDEGIVPGGGSELKGELNRALFIGKQGGLDLPVDQSAVEGVKLDGNAGAEAGFGGGDLQQVGRLHFETAEMAVPILGRAISSPPRLTVISVQPPGGAMKV